MGLNPDHNNLRRAAAAARALEAYRLANSADVDDATPCDLIADLGHYADRQGIDFPGIVACALRHWAVERNASGNDDVSVVAIHIGEGGER